MKISILSAVLLLACSACESKPVTNTQVTKTGPNGKATREAAPSTALYSVLLEISDSGSPRKLADPLFYEPRVQQCLRDAIMKSGDDFSVGISGQLSAKGALSSVKVEHQYDSLRECLGSALEKIKLGAGEPGPFKIEIFRSRITPPPGKTYELDLNGPKKFQ